MRRKIIAATVWAIAGALMLALLSLNLLVNHQKTYLLAQAEQSLGHRLSADRIEVTLWSASVRLINAALFERPDMSSGNSLRAKAIQLDLQFLPLLIGRFRARKIALDSPVISLVRGGSSASDRRAGRSNRGANNKPGSTHKQNTILLFIAPLSITDGALRYRDPETDRELTVTQINLRLYNFETGDGPFEVELAAAVMAANTNLKVKGRFGPLVVDYRDIPIDAVIQVDDLDMSKVNEALPKFKKSLPRVLQFDGRYSARELRFKGSLNRPSLKGTVSGTDTSLRFE